MTKKLDGQQLFYFDDPKCSFFSYCYIELRDGKKRIFGELPNYLYNKSIAYSNDIFESKMYHINKKK